MLKAGSTPVFYHLVAGLIALLVVIAAVSGAPFVLAHVGSQELNALLVGPAAQKDMGTLLQDLGMSDPSFLPVYGSSELRWPVPNRADRFFVTAPTGFRVCPVGGPGNTTLMTAQKIAALGDRVRDRKLVILLSCSWFRRAAIPAPDYAGNFSPPQAMNIMLDGALGSDVRRRLAERMLDYPDTLKDYPALAVCVRGEVSTDPLATMSALWQRPLLRLQQAAMVTQDHLGTVLSILIKPETVRVAGPEIPVAVPHPFSWDTVINRAAEFAAPEDPALLQQAHSPGNADAAFIAGFDNAREWADFDLLLDTCKSLGARPLVIAIPLDGAYESAHGITREGRAYYYNRLSAACAQRGTAFAHLEDHDMDLGFVIKHSSHLSGKGWIFINRLLDDFYHDRLPSAAAGMTHI